MRKITIVLAFIFAILGIVFAILPMGTLGVLPVGLSLLFGGIAFAKSYASNRNVPKWLLIVAGITLVVILVRSFIPDEVEQDAQFEQKKIESKQEDLKDLEGLE
jgi:preprotein translocase subunit SecG